MDWVKRNLAFVIGSAIAVGLLAFSGYYLYSNSKKNSDARKQLEAEYNELKRLHNLKPHPGKGDVDNIEAAREQVQVLEGAIKEVAARFEPIPAIPDGEKVTGEQFSAALRRTIEELNRNARLSSVIVPTNYNFSFEAESRLVKFAPGSLKPLAEQLGEVKAICEILFEAKVNELTGLRRESVSADDLSGPKTDYLIVHTTTNEMAEITPYQISFESFSAELSDVLAGFANSPHGMVIKGLDVTPSRVAGPPGGARVGAAASRGGVTGFYPARETTRQTTTTPGTIEGEGGEFERPRRAYGPGGGGYAPGGGAQIRRPTFNRPDLGGNQPYGGAYQQPPENPYTRRSTARPTVAPSTATSQTLIDEHPLSVTMIIEVIRLHPPQEESL